MGRDDPFSRWTVQDQISHLAFFDGAAVLAMTDPRAFQAQAASFPQDETVFEVTLEKGRRMTPAELLAWWRRERNPSWMSSEGGAKDRIEWFGPPMSVRTMATARLMETWAHGQNVADALGSASRHEAAPPHRPAGYLTFGWSFFNRASSRPTADPAGTHGSGMETPGYGGPRRPTSCPGNGGGLLPRRHPASPPYDTGLQCSGPVTEHGSCTPGLCRSAGLRPQAGSFPERGVRTRPDGRGEARRPPCFPETLTRRMPHCSGGGGTFPFPVPPGARGRPACTVYVPPGRRERRPRTDELGRSAGIR
jgi:uncharacterized protein (TIGR03083 family)